MLHFFRVSVCIPLLFLLGLPLSGEEHPLPMEQRQRMWQEWDDAIERYTKQIDIDSTKNELYSRRGDQYFFRGDFDKAVADYEKMVELDPSLKESHWRRGIAYFYAGQYKKAAHQFEIYHVFDNVDRENGIWRFFSQTSAYGIVKARQGLLKYKKDDREPFPAVYQLFSGKTTPQEILNPILSGQLDELESEKRLFYAQLYIGLNYVITKKPMQALPHLREAVVNKWGPQAGFGPNYMWHVGRLQYELLTMSKQEKKSD